MQLSGIVKLPRVPVADNVVRDEMPLYRESCGNILAKDAKKGTWRKKPDPLLYLLMLQTALEALYGHYEKVYESWQKDGISLFLQYS